MHYENRLFWEWCSQEYPRYFNDPSRVVEFGSFNINGSIRNYFKCSDYIGIDWRRGPDVDIVCLAHNAPLERESFDTVVSASMLEHDPYWKRSLSVMVAVLKKDGLFALTWGSALNAAHELKTAPDRKFHAQKAGAVMDELKALGLYIHIFRYERNILLERGEKEAIEARAQDNLCGLGSVVLVGFKDKGLAVGKSIIDPLLPEDEI
jgi:SAM-dependent methyltransferase